MKKILLLFTLFGQISFAQQIDITSVSLLKETKSGGFYHPVFSSKGTYLLTTAENYTGLNQHLLNSGEMKRITTDAGAGYDVRVSSDENSILFKRTEYKSNLRYTSLYQYNLQSEKQIQVESATREKITPAFAENKPAYVKGNALVKAQDPSKVVPFINIEDRKIALYEGNSKKILTPNGADASYLWASVSPDAKHIVYCVAGRGAFVCNINGGQVVSLGKLNAPKWLNNQWVIGMNETYDDDFVVASVIVVATIDGKVRQMLATPQTPIAMYPAASPDGKHIAFNSGDGQIYILDINIIK